MNLPVSTSSFDGELLLDPVLLPLMLQERSLDFFGEGMSSNRSAINPRRSRLVGLPLSSTVWVWVWYFVLLVLQNRSLPSERVTGDLWLLRWKDGQWRHERSEFGVRGQLSNSTQVWLFDTDAMMFLVMFYQDFS